MTTYHCLAVGDKYYHDNNGNIKDMSHTIVDPKTLSSRDDFFMTSSELSSLIDTMNYQHTKRYSIIKIKQYDKCIEVCENRTKNEDVYDGKNENRNDDRNETADRNDDRNETVDRNGRTSNSKKILIQDVCITNITLPIMGRPIYTSERADEEVQGNVQINFNDKIKVILKSEKTEKSKGEEMGENENVMIVDEKRLLRSSTSTSTSTSDSDSDSDSCIPLNAYTTSKKILFSHPKFFPDWIRKEDCT